MKKKIFSLILFTLLFSRLQAQGSQVWMFGPMLHVNFGGEKTRLSYGLEVSYWNYKNFPYSFDLGIELEKGKSRLYTEVQTGVGFAGIASGPVLEYRSMDKKLKLGFQGSIWANYFWGFDLRLRRIGGETYFSPGTYFKLPSTIFNGNANDKDSDWDWDWD